MFLSSGWTSISTVSSGTMACDWSSSCPNPLVVVEDSNFLGHSCMVFAVVCCDIYVHILKCVMMKVSDKYHF